MEDVGIFLKNLSDISFKIYRKSLISAWSISLDSTFKEVENGTNFEHCNFWVLVKT